MRNWLSDLKLPTELGKEIANIPKEVAKEVTKAMLSQADRVKDEMAHIVSKKLDDFIEQLDLAKELEKLLENSTIEMKLSIRVKKDQEPNEKQTSEQNNTEQTTTKHSEDHGQAI